jgi:hypothetical protein
MIIYQKIVTVFTRIICVMIEELKLLNIVVRWLSVLFHILDIL